MQLKIKRFKLAGVCALAVAFAAALMNGAFLSGRHESKASSLGDSEVRAEAGESDEEEDGKTRKASDVTGWVKTTAGEKMYYVI